MGDDYPMDVSKRFPLADRPKVVWRAAPQMSGLIVNASTGDMTVEAAYKTAVFVWQDVYRALAFADVLDSATKEHGRTLRGVSRGMQRIESTLGELERAVEEIRTRADQLRDTVEGLVEATGAVTIPSWVTTDEVLHGDDMGMVHRSATDLGLTVLYTPTWSPEDGVRDVLWTNPPAGTVVQRGTSIRVQLSAH